MGWSASGPAGPRPGPVRTGPRARWKRGNDGRGPAKTEIDEKEKMREERRWPKAGGVRQRGWGRGAAGKGAKDGVY